MAVHVIQESAHVLGGEITLQSPRCVCVTDCEGEIRHVAEHHSFVDELLRKIDGCVVDDELHSAEQFQHEPCGGDDHVGVELFAGREEETVFGEGLDVIGYDGDASVAYRAEEIRVGNEAQALVPRIVRRSEMFWIVVLTELVAYSSCHHPLE